MNPIPILENGGILRKGTLTLMEHNRDLLSQTAQIVSSHLSNNPVAPDSISGLIREVYSTLTKLGEAGGSEPIQTAPPLSPAVPIKRSVFPDYIVCLEDGKKLKMLKRHLMTSYQMTPDDYRQRWGLSTDYPMVAPNYAQTRSSLAKKIGLGHRPRGADIEEFQQPISAPPAAKSSDPLIQRIPAGVSGKRAPGRPRKVAA